MSEAEIDLNQKNKADDLKQIQNSQQDEKSIELNEDNGENEVKNIIFKVNEIFKRSESLDQSKMLEQKSSELIDNLNMVNDEQFFLELENVDSLKQSQFKKQLDSNILQKQNSVFDFLEGMQSHKSFNQDLQLEKKLSQKNGFSDQVNQINDEGDDSPLEDENSSSPKVEKEFSIPPKLIDSSSNFWFDEIDRFDIQINDSNYWKQYSEYMKITAIKQTLSQFRKLQSNLNKSNTYQKAIDQRDKIKQKFIQNKNDLQDKLQARIKQISEYTDSAPFMMLQDKLSFSLGVTIFGMFSYIMGRWPNDFFYIFYCTFVPLLILIRFIDYKPKGYHYFLIDFCYYAAVIVLLFIGIYPKSDILYRLSFLYSNGILAVSTAAFSNALIFHQFDHLISLVTHPVPMLCMWNVKQVTMHQEKNLPAEQRRFLQHPYDEQFWSLKSLQVNFLIPYALYIIWALVYYYINFILREKIIRERQYVTLFKYFNRYQWSSKIIEKSGPKYAPIIFMGFHFVFFTVCHIFAIFAFYFEIVHTILMFIWLYFSVWNGSCYYVKFFQYTKKLAMTEAIKKTD